MIVKPYDIDFIFKIQCQTCFNLLNAKINVKRLTNPKPFAIECCFCNDRFVLELPQIEMGGVKSSPIKQKNSKSTPSYSRLHKLLSSQGYKKNEIYSMINMAEAKIGDRFKIMSDNERFLVTVSCYDPNE